MVTEASYQNFQSLLGRNKFFRYFWQFWSNYAFVFFLIAFVIMSQSYDFHAVFGEILILSFISFLISRGILVTIINLAYEKKRPYQLYEFSPLTSKFFSFKTKTSNSFPSRHATAYFSAVAVISMYLPTLGAALFLISVMAGIGRVILGYHWPADIIAGAALGTAVGILTVVIGYPIIFT
jgi:membrane-associated phospholipid phosphatase